MSFASQERSALCDALLEAGPDAPTLCEGWTTHDLAAHVWVREDDPSAAPGLVIGALADVTASRMAATKRRWLYPELVAQIRRGPRPISVFAVPLLDDLANTTEFFVHTEDVRRPAGLPPRETSQEFEDHVAKVLNSSARHLFGKAPCGVVLERTDRSQRLRAKSGEDTVTVIGKPTELLLFGFGRMADADVRLIGAPEVIDALRASHRGV